MTGARLRWWWDLAPTLKWRFASTMSEVPPRYVRGGTTSGFSRENALRVSRLVRAFGEPGKFHRATNLYLYTPDRVRKVWCMFGDPIREDTVWIVILVEDRHVEGAYEDAADSLAQVGRDAGAVERGLDDHRPNVAPLVGADRVFGLVTVEDPAYVGAVVRQGLRAWSSIGLLHLLEPQVEEVLHGVIGGEGAVAEGAGVLDEERLEVCPRLALGLAVLAVLTHDTIDVAVPGARLPGAVCATVRCRRACGSTRRRPW